MSQNERDDYDDDYATENALSQDQIRLRQAGNCWLFVWGWFFVGACYFLRNEVLVLLVHLLMAGCFLWGGYYVREGSVNSLWVVAVGSTLVGLGYGTCGIFAGFMMSSGFTEDNGPDYAERTEGMFVIIWTGLNLLYGLVALVFTIRYSIFEDENASMKRNDPKRTKRHRS